MDQLAQKSENLTSCESGGSRWGQIFVLLLETPKYTHRSLCGAKLKIDLGLPRFYTEIYKSTLGFQDFQQRSQNFDTMMVP